MSIRYWAPKQIAELLNVDVGKPLAWLASGELVGFDVAERRGKKRRWRVADDDLRDFLRRRQNQPPPPKQQRTRRQRPTKEFV